jgi:serine/threonine protein phosphatase PrpC
MTLTLKYAVRSDRGLVRGNNEDSVYAGPRLLAIADGMGGHAAGEVASKIVIGTLEPLDEDRPIADLIGTLRDMVAEANSALANAVDEDPELEGMGTTLTAIRFADTRIVLVHVGDSRAYLMRGGQLSQITHDDTYVQSLVDSGKLTPEEASHHPRKSVILRAMNGADIDPDISIREARKGDRYLLCTDGLSDVVTTDTLLETLVSGTPQGCADRLIELALRGGGPDNVTCVVADVVELDQGDDLPLVGGAVVDATEAAHSDADSPASRAARISRDEQPAATPAVVKRGRRRFIFGLLGLLFLIGAGTAGYLWTQSQYFVGRSGDEVAIFRGVNTEFGPIKLFSTITTSQIKVADLTPVARNQVENGITASDRTDADAIVERLSEELLPFCSSTPTPTPTPTPSASKSSASRSAKPTPGKSSPTVSTSRVTPTPTPTPSASASDLPVPGIGCRAGP